MGFGKFRDGRKGVDHNRNSGSGVAADCHALGFFLRHIFRPLWVTRLPLLRPPAALVLDGLAIDLVERFSDGRSHIGRFGDAYNWMIANLDGDFRDVAVLLKDQDYVRIERAAE